MRDCAISMLPLIALILTGCSPLMGGESAEETPIPEVTATLDPNDPLVQDAQQYADTFDVSLEEAVARLSMQESIGALNAALEANEAETFAGLWIQHEPEYRVIVAFTRDGEETIQPYIEGQPFAHLVEVGTFHYSYAELQQIQKEVTDQLMANEVPFSALGVDVMSNQITIEVGNTEQFTTLLEEKGIDLPPAVVVEQVGPPGGSIFPSVAEFSAPDGRIIRLPKQASGVMQMDALISGILIEENGCLRVQYEGGSSLIIWRYDHSLTFDGQQIVVLNGQGEIVGREDEAFAMGGGDSPSVDPVHNLEGCPGPYWIGGGDARP